MMYFFIIYFRTERFNRLPSLLKTTIILHGLYEFNVYSPFDQSNGHSENNKISNIRFCQLIELEKNQYNYFVI